MPLVNDVHFPLNETRVGRMVPVESVEDVVRAVRAAGVEGRAVSIAGSRHAMGGQQFGTGTVLLDVRPMRRILAFDPAAGTVGAGIDQVEAGHPRLRELLRQKRERDPQERFQSDWYRHYREMFAEDLV